MPQTAIIIYGSLSVGLSFMIANVQGPIMQVAMAASSAVLGPLSGLFLLSAIRLFSWCQSRAVFIAGLMGFGCNLWLCIGSAFLKTKPPPLPVMSLNNCTASNITLVEYPELTGIDKFYSLSYIWFVLFGASVTVVCGLVTGAIMFKCNKKGRSRDIPDHLFVQFTFKHKDYVLVQDQAKVHIENGIQMDEVCPVT